ncbi:gp018 [Erwinia phage vB_EamP-S6]|uniref:Gp018 n=1 Tax=Erwinia phage vB_EamP-S6 TaxID=1051675 RepID=G0YQB0_9CAUD|nr:gp018 [Erwinia phage vB_EamP-S6]AEJ81537.1 gp018 [Erwinia phage vB_EamP-S6]
MPGSYTTITAVMRPLIRMMHYESFHLDDPRVKELVMALSRADGRTVQLCIHLARLGYADN